MKKNRRNLILFTAGLIFLVAALIAFNMYNKGFVDVANGQAIITNPESLYTSYVTDNVTAHKTLNGKVVQLTGQVSGITTNTQNQQVLLIKTSTSGGHINCTMEQAAPNPISGGMITVKGICIGLGEGDSDLGIPGDVYLIRAVIVD